MLKIKDNVDLKELEKLGFAIRQTVIGFNYELYTKIDYGYEVLVTIWFLTEDKKQRYELINSKIISGQIEISTGYTDECLSIIFDLIQAGLIEKFLKPFKEVK